MYHASGTQLTSAFIASHTHLPTLPTLATHCSPALRGISKTPPNLHVNGFTPRLHGAGFHSLRIPQPILSRLSPDPSSAYNQNDEQNDKQNGRRRLSDFSELSQPQPQGNLGQLDKLLNGDKTEIEEKSDTGEDNTRENYANENHANENETSEIDIDNGKDRDNKVYSEIDKGAEPRQTETDRVRNRRARRTNKARHETICKSLSIQYRTIYGGLFRRIKRKFIYDFLRKNILEGLSNCAFSEEAVTAHRAKGCNPKLLNAPEGISVKETAIGKNRVYAEWLIPDNERREDQVILYFFGGAYVTGSPPCHRVLTGNLARMSNTRILSSDYSKIPETSFPAANNDATNAYQYLLDKGYKPENIVIVADSSGGHLALSTMVTLRERNIPLPKAIALLSPWTDMTFSGDSIKDKAGQDPIIPANRLPEAADLFCGDIEDRATPKVSPLFADYSDYPPMLIHCGEQEILLDDSIRLAERAEKAGVEVEAHIWRSMPHVFQLLYDFTPEARIALEEIASFVNKHLSNSTQTG